MHHFISLVRLYAPPGRCKQPAASAVLASAMEPSLAGIAGSFNDPNAPPCVRRHRAASRVEQLRRRGAETVGLASSGAGSGAVSSAGASWRGEGGFVIGKELQRSHSVSYASSAGSTCSGDSLDVLMQEASSSRDHSWDKEEFASGAGSTGGWPLASGSPCASAAGSTGGWPVRRARSVTGSADAQAAAIAAAAALAQVAYEGQPLSRAGATRWLPAPADDEQQGHCVRPCYRRHTKPFEATPALPRRRRTIQTKVEFDPDVEPISILRFNTSG